MAKGRRAVTQKIYATVLFFLTLRLSLMVDFSFPVCNDKKKTPQLWVDPFPDGRVYLLYEKPFSKGWLEFLGSGGRETQLLTVHFDRELMKDCSSGS